ncbi:MAG: hypothetical protein JOZ88_09030, partial [Hyphomicrobiales bacterium]|nr:hypothetical protein [Hyphomicrobiales bacterium]
MTQQKFSRACDLTLPDTDARGHRFADLFAASPSSRNPIMTDTRYDVLGLGNAIVDVIARTDDDFLKLHKLNKGAMTLIEEERAETLFHAMGPAEIISGGCAANTASGVASL